MGGTEGQSQQDDVLRRRAQQRMFLFRAASLILVALMAIGFSTVFVARQGLTRWWVIPIFFLPFVVLAAMTVVVLRLQRSGHRWFPQPVRLVGADRATRRRVRRMVRKGQLPPRSPIARWRLRWFRQPSESGGHAGAWS